MRSAYDLIDNDQLVRLTMFVGCLVMAAFLIAARANGLTISVHYPKSGMAVMLVGALAWIWHRHRRSGGDRRLADSALVVMSLFAGGLAGGIICLIGQTFALPFIDPYLSAFDRAIGLETPKIVAVIASIGGFPALLKLAYTSSFPLVFVSGLVLIWLERRDRALELCGLFNICLLGIVIFSALIPAAGPFHHLGVPADVRAQLPFGAGVYYLEDLFALRNAMAFEVDPSHLQGVAVFPSFHTALALMTLTAWREVPTMRNIMIGWQSLVLLSTLPIGGHYVADVVAGALCFGAAYWIWAKLTSGGREQALEMTPVPNAANATS